MDTFNDAVVTDDMFTEEYWYKKFDELTKQEYNFTRVTLEPFDDEFKLARANNYIPYVRKRKAGIKIVRKVCLALEKHIAAKQATEIKPEQIRKRQRLIPS